MFRLLIPLMGLVLPAAAQETLPGTARWDFPADIVTPQYDELRAYFEARIAEAEVRRGGRTPSVDEARAELRRIIGAVDRYLPQEPVEKPLSETAPLKFSLVEWPILRLGSLGSTSGSAGVNVRFYGLLIETKRAGKHPAVVAIPDATQSPADIAGLTDRLPKREQYARSLAVEGYVVLVPFFVQRRTFSQPWLEDRAWLVRLGYQVGRHLIGSEVQQVSAAVDFLSKRASVDAGRIGVVGAGQGGLTAMYAAALDTRIQATLTAGYFDRRDRVYEEPEDRILWNHLSHFGDAEVAALIAPRTLVIDRGGPRADQEFAKAQKLFAKTGGTILHVKEQDQRHGPSSLAIERFDETLKPSIEWIISLPQTPMDVEPFHAIANAQFSQWQARWRNMAMEAYGERDKKFRPDVSSVAAYEKWAQPMREVYWDTVGRYPAPSGSLDARSVKLYDEPGFTGYRLQVRVYDGVHAYGILLVPKGIRPGERRPVVFTQHGQAGIPEHALGVIPDEKADAVYSRFGLELVKRGYIVFAPMISTQNTPGRYSLVRRAQPVGLTPVGMEVKKAGRVLDFLSTLPYVDSSRFGFYGLSYGGLTALWTGAGEPRFRATVCSGYFNDWNLKTTDLTEGTSFLFYKETFDMFNFDILHRFNHSGIATLTAPRAFLIEIGDVDGIVVEPRRFVDVEMARVTELYRALGIPERGRVARFHGPHRVDGKEAYQFLDEMLDWKPAR